MAIVYRSGREKHEATQLRVFQIILLLFSTVFLAILFGGWITLFTSLGTFTAPILAIALALLAWFLGRWVGMSEGGMKQSAPMFAMLLLLSAAGVFNFMMVTLEAVSYTH